ncbi:hypothetical protein EDD15DRAFT_2196638 [Pisolithus albus]|nr:hypothetical protein EDD15DRAFT_2196638 [Pisolithus albus]
MSYCNIPSPATHLAKSVTSQESAWVKAFVHTAMEQGGLTEEEVRKRAIKAYGSMEATMEATEIDEAEIAAAMEMVLTVILQFKLGDSLSIQVWGGDLEKLQHYCLDFVDGENRYILAPDDVKIYTLATPFFPSTRLLSMEDAVEKVNAKSLYSHATRQDPNWEMYLAHEGDVLHITQQNHPDCYINIPVHAMHHSTLVLQPW